MSNRSARLRQAVIATLAFAAAPTFAQQPAPTDENQRTIENIIVTAQKREQSLQDVPIVVTAVSEQLLQDTGVKDIKDLTVLTPGLTVTSTSSEASTTARVRGIGTVGDNPGLESSVGVVIDGVYRPRNGVGFGDLGELDRIEVLKGPQGTLFGKNTSAGVINIVTKRPTQDFSSQIELTGGNYGVLEGSASINGGLREGVAGRLYVGARERDGFLDVNVGPGPRTEREDNDRKVATARGQLLFEPSDALDIRLTGDYSERDESCCGAMQTINGPTTPAIDAIAGGRGVNAQADAFDRDTYMNRGTEQEIEDLGGSAEINYDFDALGGATLTSISAYRTWESVNAQDTDFTTADIWYRAPDGNHETDFKQVSQEFRIAGETDKLSWLAGAFYADETLESRQQLQYGSQFRNYMLALTGGTASPLLPLLIGTTPAAQAALAPAYATGLGQRDFHDQQSESWAIFTNNSIRFTDALEFTVGVRYTNESKDLDTQYRNTHTGVGCQVLRNALPSLLVAPAALRTVAYGIGCAAFTDPIYNNLDNSQSIDENEWSGTAKLAYRFTDDVMTYVSFARGYKAGGFNLDRVRTGASPALNPTTPDPCDTEAGVGASCDTSFDKELVDSYELGVKTQWADNSLLLNASVFYQDYTDFQLNTFDGVQFLVTSVDQVTSEGVDLDVVWFTPLEQLSIQGGVTYAKTEIEDPVALANPGLFAQNRKNDRLSFAPEWSGSLSVTFEQPLGTALVWRTNVGAKYTSEYNTGSNLVPQKIQEELTLVSARTGFGAEDETWMIEAWAQNLTDEEYYQVVFDAPLQTGSFNAFLGAPRTYGMTARFKF